MEPSLDEKLSRLLRRGQAGDALAYESFLREVSTVLRSFLRKRMSDAGAEDVLQETLISLHRSRHTFLPNRPLGPWLYAICEHRMLDHFRECRRRGRLVGSLKRESSIPSSEPEFGSRLVSIVSRLPAIQKKVIELLKIQDLSVREVSVELKMSESAVKVTAHRGYEALRKMLGGRHED